MYEPIICRICLAAEGEMHNLNNTTLKILYERISDSVVQENGLPQTVCIECLHVLNEFETFKYKCLKALKIMHNIINSGQKITKSTVLLTNNKDEKLTTKPRMKEKSKMKGEELKDIIEELAVEFNVEGGNRDDLHLNLLGNKIDEDSTNSSEHVDNEKKGKVDGNDLIIEQDNNFEELYEDSECVLIKNEFQEEKVAILDEKPSNFIHEKSLKKLKGSSKKLKKKKKLSTKDIELVRRFDKRYKKPKDLVGEFIIENFLTEDEQRIEFEARRNSESYLKSKYKCDFCLIGFREQKLIDIHMEKHEETSGSIVCPICHIRLLTTKRFRTHRDNNHTAKFSCKKCTYVTFSKAQARYHYTWHQGVEHTCPHCGKSFRKFTTYMGHLRKAHPSKHICATCANSFVSEHGLHFHRKLAHKAEDTKSNDSDKTPCVECQVTFDSHKIYIKHILISPQHKNIANTILGCIRCGEQFSDKDAMSQHRHNVDKYKRKVVQNDIRESIKCPQCNEHFVHPTSAYQHFIKVHPNQPYTIARQRKDYLCELCGSTFMCQAKLDVHKRLHNGERPFDCSECVKCFRTKHYLDKHINNTHKRLRPHVCKECGKAFTKNGLYKHMRIHKGIKAFVCDICDKAFVDSSNLRQHVRGVHCNVRRSRRR